MKNAGKACNNRLYRHIRTFEKIVKNYFVIYNKYKVSKYIFFSLSGYTDWYDSLADEDVLLLTLDSLYE